MTKLRSGLKTLNRLIIPVKHTMSHLSLIGLKVEIMYIMYLFEIKVGINECCERNNFYSMLVYLIENDVSNDKNED